MAVKIFIDSVAMSQLKSCCEKALEATALIFGEECVAVIESDSKFIGAESKDVGINRLRDSMRAEVSSQSSRREVTLSWNPRDLETGRFYAADIFVGFERTPGRNWPERARRRRDWDSVFAQELHSALSERGSGR